jgi:hypothetical protein
MAVAAVVRAVTGGHRLAVVATAPLTAWHFNQIRWSRRSRI